jgi:membrane protein implicated in regulation of membrane protease activity
MSPSLNRVGLWVWFPFGVVLRFIARSGKRIAVTVVGFVLLLAGIVMIVTPGPGILLIIAGLAVLATEYVWAERLLNLAKQKAARARDAITRRGRTGPDESDGGSGAMQDEPPFL